MHRIVLRHPEVDDGFAVWELVRHSQVLDVNSVYAYCATFRHFAPTCVVAEVAGEIVGFVTGYRVPGRREVLFVWQVAVSENARGLGLATRMLQWLLERRTADGVQWIETTVTPDNVPSRALFTRLAARLDTRCHHGPGISSDQLGGGHEPEELFRIGPIARSDS